MQINRPPSTKTPTVVGLASGRFLPQLCAAVAFACVIFSAAPGFGQPAETDAPSAEISVGANEISDAAIKARLSEIFAEVEGTQNIEVSVDAGVVTLSGTVADPAARQQALRLANRVQGTVTVRNNIEVVDDVAQRITPAIERLKDRIFEAIALLPLLGVGIVVFLLVTCMGFVVAGRESLWARLTPNAFVADLVKQMVRLAFIAAALVLALDLIGATTLLGTLLGAAGIIGLAVGFAVRDTIENYIASIMLSIRQPFRPNELVRIGEHQGHVVRLSSRATILITPEGNHVRIPNAVVFKAEIINYTRNPQRRFDFQLGVNADADLKAALSTGLTVLTGIDEILSDPEPDGWIDSVGDSNVVLWFGAWVDQDRHHFARTRSKAIRRVKDALEAGGFELPEPIYRVRLTDIPSSAQALLTDGAHAADTSTGDPGIDAASQNRPRPAQDQHPGDVVEPRVDPEDVRQDNPIIDAVEADRAAGGEDLLRQTAKEE